MSVVVGGKVRDGSCMFFASHPLQFPCQTYNLFSHGDLAAFGN
jgi:hypothetical protein